MLKVEAREIIADLEALIADRDRWKAEAMLWRESRHIYADCPCGDCVELRAARAANDEATP